MEPIALVEWLESSLTSLSMATDEANRIGFDKLAFVLDRMAEAVCSMLIEIEGVAGC